MTLHEVAEQYIEGQKFYRQSRELCNASLARKFERSVHTIRKVVNGVKTNVPEAEQRLIRQCASERDRLKSKYSGLLRHELCHKYGFEPHQLQAELVRMGHWRVSQ